MQVSEIAFDPVVAQSLARAAESNPQAVPLLQQCVQSWLAEHGPALIAIAQEGKIAMADALKMAVMQCESSATLGTLFEALPVHTVLLRDFAIQVTGRLLQLQGSESLTPPWLMRLSQFGARLREGGLPSEGLQVLQPLLKTPAFAQASPIERAHVLTNLGTCLGDLGQDQPSFAMHQASIQLFNGVELDGEALHLLCGSLLNLAAMGLRLWRQEEVDSALHLATQLIGQLHDLNLEFRLNLLRLTALAEAQKFEQALEVGAQFLPRVRDYEEFDSEAYGPMLVDCLVNLGSIAMDLMRHDEALDYLTQAVSIAVKVVERADSPQARAKEVTAKIALLNHQTERALPGVASNARAVEARVAALLAENPNEYYREIHDRALELLVRASTVDQQGHPAQEEISALVERAEKEAQSGIAALIWQGARCLHTAAMAYSKRGECAAALAVAQRAQQLTAPLPGGASLHNRAHHAVFVDSVSRRLFENKMQEAALLEAERGLLLMVAIWREEPEVFQHWLSQMLGWYGQLCEKTHSHERGKVFCAEKLDLVVQFEE